MHENPHAVIDLEGLQHGLGMSPFCSLIRGTDRRHIPIACRQGCMQVDH